MVRPFLDEGRRMPEGGYLSEKLFRVMRRLFLSGE